MSKQTASESTPFSASSKWQRPAYRLGRLPPRRRRCRRPGRLGALAAFRAPFLQVADQQIKLLDVAVELLRGATEARTPQQGELRLQLLDMHGLGVNLGLQRLGERP
jgi:hypothetical protein